jgi:predicted nucleotide-binding protein (sugar kinase/HSP70/actin superfamily)
MATVGIPRSLLYYQFYPMWKTFFEHLGGEVVLSDPTTRTFLSTGSARVVADTCLPVKVYVGHVLSLVDKCDFLFIPSIRSIEENVYNCSKFLGLPDVVKAVVPEAPPILDPDIDINQGKRGLYAAIYALGRHFTWNPVKVKNAAEAAWEAHHAHANIMREEKLPPSQAAAKLLGEQDSDQTPGAVFHSPQSNGKRGLTIGVIGHPYLIYDAYINHRLLEKLSSLGVEIVTAEHVGEDELNSGVERLVGKPYWTFEDEVVGAGGHYLHSEVDGVVCVVAFGCGPDSVMVDVLQRHAKKQSTTPFMALTIDEHTAETGLITRLEAFVDMISRRKLGLAGIRQS